MIEINPTLFKVKPFAHQVDGVKKLAAHLAFALFDEMGVGKTKQVIDAANVLHEAADINVVVVVAPAMVKSVWLDPDIGEIVKFSWRKSKVHDYSGKLCFLPQAERGELLWVVVSYEFIRQEVHLKRLISFMKSYRTLLVLDESSCIKNHKAQQTKSCFRLGKAAKRRVILNGTPIANSPMDLYAQMAFLDEQILGFRNFYCFRNHHAVMGGYLNKQVVSFTRLEELQRKIAPYCLRRLKEDCIDLEPKIMSHLEVPLSPANWKVYKDMRDEMVAYLGNQVSLSRHAAVKLLRLCQITSGFLGGLELVDLFPEEDPVIPEDVVEARMQMALGPPLAIGEEKMEATMAWVRRTLELYPHAKIIIWCRFRPELTRMFHAGQRLFDELRLFPQWVHMVQGGQGEKDRAQAKAFFHPDTAPASTPALLVAQPQAGKFGLNLSAANFAVYASNDYNLLTRSQSEDRIHRPGQRQQTYFLDVIATGPAGQKTVDHQVVKALLKKQNLATLTADAWRQMLSEE